MRSTKPPLPEAVQQPFSMQYLLVWVGLFAVCFAIERRVWEGPSEIGPLSAWEFQAAVIAACGVQSLFVWRRRWMRGFAFPTEPGEWMLVVIGLQYVLRPLNNHIVDVNFADDSSAAWLAWTAIHVSPMLLPIVHSHDMSCADLFRSADGDRALKLCNSDTDAIRSLTVRSRQLFPGVESACSLGLDCSIGSCS